MIAAADSNSSSEILINNLVSLGWLSAPFASLSRLPLLSVYFSCRFI